MARLTEMFLNGTNSIVQSGKLLSDMFPSWNGLEQGNFYRHCFSTLL